MYIISSGGADCRMFIIYSRGTGEKVSNWPEHFGHFFLKRIGLAVISSSYMDSLIKVLGTEVGSSTSN